MKAYDEMSREELIVLLNEYEKPKQSQTINFQRNTPDNLADIKELVKMEQALKESDKTIRELFNIPINFMAMVDVEYNFVMINEATASFFGESIDKLIGENVKNVFSDDTLDSFILDLQKVLESGKYLHSQVNKDGQWYDTIFYPIYNLEGIVNKIAIFIRDITEWKINEIEKFELEKKLRQAQKMEAIGTLSAGIAHDFNNILSIIIGYTELTTNNVSKDSESFSYLNNVLKASKRAKDLVKQILTFSRKNEQMKQPFQISYIIKEAIEFVRASIPRSIEMKEHIYNKDSVVMADPTQIHQVILNLYINSYHAMKNKGGTIELSLKNVSIGKEDVQFYDGITEGKYVKISIKDTGHGMDKFTMERIFDPYFTTKPSGEGSGIGLAVVHGIVKSHNGDIKVHSKENEGTTFEIYLARIDTFKEAEFETLNTLPLGKGRILFVDDEEDLVSIVKVALEELGYELTAKTSGLEALEEFSGDINKFDIFITDLQMSKITGDELSKKLLQLRHDIPILVCTGDVDEIFSNEKFKDINIRGFIKKPFSNRIMAEKIHEILNNEDSVVLQK